MMFRINLKFGVGWVRRANIFIVLTGAKRPLGLQFYPKLASSFRSTRAWQTPGHQEPGKLQIHFAHNARCLVSA